MANNNIKILNAIKSGEEFFFGDTKYTIEEFANDFCNGNTDKAFKSISQLTKRGDINLTLNETTQEKILEKNQEEESIKDQVNAFEDEEEKTKDYLAKQARQGYNIYEEIQIEFPNYSRASKAQEWIAENLRVTDTSIIQGIPCVLVINNIAHNEYVKLTRYYKTCNIVNKTNAIANKAIDSTTKAIDVGAKEIIAPTLKIATKATVGITKSLASVTMRAGAGIINETSKGVSNIIKETKEDEELIRAKNNLTNFKNSFKGLFGGAKKSKGIKIIK